MEQAFGRIDFRPPAARPLLKVRIRARGAVPASDGTCLREMISRRLLPHGYHCLKSPAGNSPSARRSDAAKPPEI